MPSTGSGLTIGERLAMARKVAGLSQHALATRAAYSVSMVRAVEQGREPASPAFVAAAARALGIEAEELYGQPYRELLGDDGGVDGLFELRTLFAEGCYVEPLVPAPLDELDAEMRRLRQMRHTDRARQAIETMPVLLRQIYGAVREASADEDRERAYRLLAQGYANTAQMLYRFGWLALATQALDRMELAAERSGGPHLLAHATQQRALLLMSHASYDVGERLVERSLGLLEREEESEGVLALRGSAHLRGAIICARKHDETRAREHIAHARRYGARIGRQSSAYDTSFGPGNVEIHDTAVSLEVGDPWRAARDGSALDIPADVTPTRAGHHWQDVARAWVLSGEHGKALGALNKARAIAPQQTRYHPQVHETARLIALAERRKSDSIAHFTAWLGIKV
ncbi:helix-turn-helix domain-containing protein [Saccharopolyspora erythraea]|uniref:helix-turn-helix domain-containing protein n=1 Tax=Saccharopolyspora erythraea TaxID=1836 RepID=UPI001BA4C443|nr:helix-turn-helix domain-containing protein [Saccharopolyspora erythraea]QUG99945.1 helix-turn-helix domain-containing protein [Saccharopolyspora erythraea]